MDLFSLVRKYIQGYQLMMCGNAMRWPEGLLTGRLFILTKYKSIIHYKDNLL